MVEDYYNFRFITSTALPHRWGWEEGGFFKMCLHSKYIENIGIKVDGKIPIVIIESMKKYTSICTRTS